MLFQPLYEKECVTFQLVYYKETYRVDCSDSIQAFPFDMVIESHLEESFSAFRFVQYALRAARIF